MIEDSFDLLYALKQLGYIKEERDSWWWPRSGTFEVVVGALLTQQSKWERVELSLKQLKEANLLSIEALVESSTSQIAPKIRPSGFYNTKAKRLQMLACAIYEEFGTFEAFVKRVDRAWLLAQKGIGKESADAILCYGCRREAMVVDSYTARLLQALGYELRSYEQIQDWLISSIDFNHKKVLELYGYPIGRAELFARFHGKIVEYAKEYIRGKKVEIRPLLNQGE